MVDNPKNESYKVILVRNILVPLNPGASREKKRSNWGWEKGWISGRSRKKGWEKKLKIEKSEEMSEESVKGDTFYKL